MVAALSMFYNCWGFPVNDSKVSGQHANIQSAIKNLTKSLAIPRSLKRLSRQPAPPLITTTPLQLHLMHFKPSKNCMLSHLSTLRASTHHLTSTTHLPWTSWHEPPLCVQPPLIAPDLNIWKWVITSFFECDKLDQSVGGTANSLGDVLWVLTCRL